MFLPRLVKFNFAGALPRTQIGELTAHSPKPIVGFREEMGKKCNDMREEKGCEGSEMGLGDVEEIIMETATPAIRFRLRLGAAAQESQICSRVLLHCAG